MTASALPRTDTATAPVLHLRGVTKRFGAMTAVDAVDLEVRAGEIHALLGENGAGKSTLMNCLFGLLQPDEGQILLEGQPIEVTSPRRAQALGIGMVHQHFKLVPSMTVAENVFLGNEPVAGPFLKRRAARDRVRELVETYGLRLDPDDVVGSLSVGAQQRVEILRALSSEVKILVLDEPTAVLTPAETERFFEVVRGFAARGLAVILISHHLKEVRAVADHVSVLRRGKKVADLGIDEVTNAELAALITGEERAIVSEVEMRRADGPRRLEVQGLHVVNQRGTEKVKGVDLDVAEGEIVGVLGLAGNGQTELVEAITGLRPVSGGRVVVDGTDVTNKGPGALRAAGIAHIPENRILRGMAGYWPVRDNIAVGYLDTPEVGTRLLSRSRISALVEKLMRQFDVRASGQMQLARRLSGGNAQKMVLARELSREPDLVICAEPTRGLDIAAAEFVRNELVARRDAGSAVLLISSELEEVVQIADRLLVMSAGRIVARFEGRRPTEAEIGRAILGGEE
ncbi:ABC transporter ATP-binding protein [Pseudoroseicyclus sp. H15]